MTTSTTHTQEPLISGADAARLVGYTSDYIAKLARDGKIVGKRIGKAWHVSRVSLLDFKERVDIEKQQRRESLRQERLLEQVQQEVPIVVPSVSTPSSGIPTSFAIPTRSLFRPVRRAVVETALIVLLGLTTGVVTYGIIEDDSVVGVSTGVFQRLFSEDSVALVAQPENELNTTVPRTERETRVVIAPDAVLTAEHVQMITDSLSDEVTVLPDPDHPESGVIIPHFKDADGEPYRFLTLPVDLES